MFVPGCISKMQPGRLYRMDLPGERFLRDADSKLFLAFLQDSGKLAEIRSILFPDGRSELRIQLFGKLNLLIADLI